MSFLRTGFSLRQSSCRRLPSPAGRFPALLPVGSVPSHLTHRSLVTRAFDSSALPRYRRQLIATRGRRTSICAQHALLTSCSALSFNAPLDLLRRICRDDSGACFILRHFLVVSRELTRSLLVLPGGLITHTHALPPRADITERYFPASSSPPAFPSSGGPSTRTPLVRLSHAHTRCCSLVRPSSPSLSLGSPFPLSY